MAFIRSTVKGRDDPVPKTSIVESKPCRLSCTRTKMKLGRAERISRSEINKARCYFQENRFSKERFFVLTFHAQFLLDLRIIYFDDFFRNKNLEIKKRVCAWQTLVVEPFVEHSLNRNSGASLDVPY